MCALTLTWPFSPECSECESGEESAGQVGGVGWGGKRADGADGVEVLIPAGGGGGGGRADFNVHTGSDGTDVVERVVKREERFDMLLLDERLKVMNGSEACLCVREYEVEAQLPEMPIIALSANVEPDDLVHLVCPAHVSVVFWGSLWFCLALFGPAKLVFYIVRNIWLFLVLFRCFLVRFCF